MELQEIPAPVPDTEPTLNPENPDVDRIAFELWQRGSLPEVAAASEAEVEDLAAHASCL
jgi:hypothetical protein